VIFAARGLGKRIGFRADPSMALGSTRK